MGHVGAYDVIQTRRLYFLTKPLLVLNLQIELNL